VFLGCIAQAPCKVALGIVNKDVGRAMELVLSGDPRLFPPSPDTSLTELTEAPEIDAGAAQLDLCAQLAQKASATAVPGQLRAHLESGCGEIPTHTIITVCFVWGVCD
jgi:hypothetical protein